MALTRSRPVAGDERLCEEIREAVREAIASHQDDPLLSDDVADMRARLDLQSRRAARSTSSAFPAG